MGRSTVSSLPSLTRKLLPRCPEVLLLLVLSLTTHDLFTLQGWTTLTILAIMSIASLLARQEAEAPFDPSSVDLDTADARDVVCYLNAGENEYDGRLGARISAIFVILIVSSAVTFFPVIATRSKRLRIPLYVYLFARYFGTGVIVATAFIQ